MGRLLLVLRLANRDLRRHAGQAVLMLLTIASTTTTLTLGLALHGTSTDTWNLTRASSAGPDVMVQTYVSKGATDARVTELMHVPGVADASGPFPLASPVLRVRQVADPIFAEGRDETLPSVDRPFVTDGSWVRPFGVVVERGFAKALKVGPGDAITLDGEPFTVVGEAVGTAWCANWRPQLIWTTRSDAEHLQSVEGQKAYAANLRLSDPNAARRLRRRVRRPGAVHRDLAGHQGVRREVGHRGADRAAGGHLAAGHAFDLEHRRPGRRPDGRADPPGRAPQGGRGHPVAGGAGPAGGEPGAGVGRGRDRTRRRAARGAGAVQSWRFAARRRERAVGDRGHGAAGGRRGRRGGRVRYDPARCPRHGRVP